jgi:fructokinase
MRKVYTIGETVYDIIFRNFEPVSANPGGAMLNTAISLGRLNIPVYFISEFANDTVGCVTDKFLVTNKVSTEYIYRYKNGKSAISLAFLDENKNAGYSFYKFYPDKRLNIKFPEINKDDIVLFGSFYSVTKEVRRPLTEFISSAKEKNAIIIYDPNIREPHKKELPEYLDFIYENISFADIVRASDEDFNVIFDISNPADAYKLITSNNCRNLIYTAGAGGVYLHSSDYSKKYAVPKISPVSTIGAGDNFNAGVIFSILKNNIKKEDINCIEKKQWDKIINSGIKFGTNVCLSLENYISF